MKHFFPTHLNQSCMQRYCCSLARLLELIISIVIFNLIVGNVKYIVYQMVCV
jgi:hypothetical protein